MPVLVKASYFPNWRGRGAEGPYRVAPNLMVVVPTDTHVELTYGRTWVEYLSYSLTLLGIVGLVLLARRGTCRVAPAPAGAGARCPDARLGRRRCADAGGRGADGRRRCPSTPVAVDGVGDRPRTTQRTARPGGTGR